MADTGAPWNIPYVEPTDLVREYPAADEAQANAIAAGLTAAGNAGIGSNVVSVTVDSPFSTSSGDFQDITDYTVTITPTANTSKILVMWSAMCSSSSTSAGFRFTLLRDAVNLGGGGTGANQVVGTMRRNINVDNAYTVSGALLDSPATTSPVIYKGQINAVGGGTARIGDNGGADTPRPYYLTVVEVAA